MRSIVISVSLIVWFSGVTSFVARVPVENILSSKTRCINFSTKERAQRLRSCPILLNAKTPLDDDSISSSKFQLTPRSIAYFSLWFGFLLFGFVFSPGRTPDAQANDFKMIMDIINKQDGQYSPIFLTIFNFLGLLPLIYASLLLPGAKNQFVPPQPFVLLSILLGFAGLGPYLGLRKDNTNVTQSTRGRGSAIFEFKGTSVLILAGCLYLCYAGYSSPFPSDRWEAFLTLFKTSSLACASTVDFTILSFAVSTLYQLIQYTQSLCCSCRR